MVAVKNFFKRFYVGIVFFILYAPILVLIALSFNASRSRAVWGGFTLEWYGSMFRSEVIMDALTTTLFLALTSALIATAIGTVACIGLDGMKKRPRALLLGATNIPLLNADIVTGISLMLLFVRFAKLGFSTVLISHITFNLPYVILSVMPRLRQRNVSVFEAALDLGASPIKAFFKVTLPDIFPGILSGFLLAFTMSLDDFAITYFTKSPAINTLSTMIYAQRRKGIKPELYALSTIMFLAVLIVLFAVNRISAKKSRSVERI